jgi:hypothetical protein
MFAPWSLICLAANHLARKQVGTGVKPVLDVYGNCNKQIKSVQINWGQININLLSA